FPEDNFPTTDGLAADTMKAAVSIGHFDADGVRVNGVAEVDRGNFHVHTSFFGVFFSVPDFFGMGPEPAKSADNRFVGTVTMIDFSEGPMQQELDFLWLLAVDDPGEIANLGGASGVRAGRSYHHRTNDIEDTPGFGHSEV